MIVLNKNVDGSSHDTFYNSDGQRQAIDFSIIKYYSNLTLNTIEWGYVKGDFFLQNLQPSRGKAAEM